MYTDRPDYITLLACTRGYQGEGMEWEKNRRKEKKKEGKGKVRGGKKREKKSQSGKKSDRNII